jgi:hypothetical protein
MLDNARYVDYVEQGTRSQYLGRMADRSTTRSEAVGVDGARDAAAEPYDPIAEQNEARRARAERDGALSMSERLERLHKLCGQLAAMTPARPRQRA